MGFLTKQSADLVFDLINTTNSVGNVVVALDDTKVTLGAPVVITPGQDGHNTEMKVERIKGAGYVGDVTVTFIRLDIAALFNKIAVNLDVAAPTTTADLLEKLNAKYGLQLEVGDIVDSPVATAVGDDPIQHTIVMAPSCPAYIGELDITIGEDPEVGERLNTVILKTNLDGLLYPNADTSKAQARQYSWGIDGNPIVDYLSKRVVGEVVADASLAISLNKVVPDLWVYDAAGSVDYNTAGAEVVYVGVTDPTIDAPSRFNRVVQFKLKDDRCANMGGLLTLGYDAP